MTRRFIQYPKTHNFSYIVKEMGKGLFSHYDEALQVPVYNDAPKMTFIGTVKLHGTNAAVCLDLGSGEVWAQSRNNIITPLGDNAGFAEFVEPKKELFRRMLTEMASHSNTDDHWNGKIITLFGEWAGSNIQKGVAITNLEKTFFPFAIKVSPADKDQDSEAYWIPLHDFTYEPVVTKNLHFITQFQKYVVEIDFNDEVNVRQAVVELEKLTQEVEDECPVAKHFGFEGVGEGIVWSHIDDNGNRLSFKTKGEKHSSSKHNSKVKVEVAPEKMKTIQDFIDTYALTEVRLNQAIKEVNAQGMQDTGVFLKWVSKDIIEEETLPMGANNLTWDDIKGTVNKQAVNWFKKNV